MYYFNTCIIVTQKLCRVQANRSTIVYPKRVYVVDPSGRTPEHHCE